MPPLRCALVRQTLSVASDGHRNPETISPSDLQVRTPTADEKIEIPDLSVTFLATPGKGFFPQRDTVLAKEQGSDELSSGLRGPSEC